MNYIDFKNDSGVLTIFAKGRIDSSVAPAVEAEVDAVRAENPHSAIVFDVEQLEYISSAGLRMVLRLRKSEPTLKVINASSDVYDVFEMTGFTEMMPVEKAYRKISVDGCEVIGQGANGKVYRLDAETIIKVYMNPESLSDIQRERELARKAFVLGIPTAIPYDVVRVGESYGSVFELLNAKSFAKLTSENPDKIDTYIGLSIDLLKKIHSTVVNPDDVPDIKERALGWVKFLADYLPAEKEAKLISLVEAVPDDNHMIHGDFHVKNVMMQNGEVLLIDMDTLCHGNPVFEFSSIFNAYVGFPETSDPDDNFLGISAEASERFWEKSLELYFGTTDKAVLAEKADKIRLLSYARLMRRFIRLQLYSGSNERDAKRVEIYKEHLLELLDKVDTLYF